jgi:hypothetical protein
MTPGPIDTPAEIKALTERFRQSPEVLAQALAGATAEETRFQPAPGKWSIREITAHLADTEIVAGMRLRQMLGESKPLLTVFDQDAWAKAFEYNERDVAASLETFRTLRAVNAALLDTMPAGAFHREGIHPERGVTTVGEWVERFTKHVERHAQQIADIRAVWGK